MAKQPAKKAPAKKPDSKEMDKEIARVRDTILARIGQVTLSLMGVPRYNQLPISDLQALCLTPLMRDRVAIATSQPRTEQAAKSAGADSHALMAPLVGIAIWANVADNVHEKVRSQISAGVFPVRIAADEWTGGDNIWLLDVIAPTQDAAASVLSNFSKVLKAQLPKDHSAHVNLHPVIKKMIGEEMLMKMGAKTAAGNEPEKQVPKKPASKKPTSKKPSGKPGKKRVLN